MSIETRYEIRVPSPIALSTRVFLAERLAVVINQSRHRVNALLMTAPGDLNFNLDRNTNEQVITVLKGAAINAELLEVHGEGSKVVVSVIAQQSHGHKAAPTRLPMLLGAVATILTISLLAFQVGRLSSLPVTTQIPTPTLAPQNHATESLAPSKVTEATMQETMSPLPAVEVAAPAKPARTVAPKRNKVVAVQQSRYELAQLPTETGAFKFIPIEAWAGRGVVFLESPESLQEYGFLSVYRQLNGLEVVPYEELAGKTGVVVSVEEDFIVHDVEIRLNEGRTYYAKAYDESVSNIAFLRDILDAETYYEGKTLWIKEPTHEESKIARFARVKVTEIRPSFFDSAPVEFIVVDTSGQQESYFVNMSGTNTGDILFDDNRFEDTFYTADPRQTYRWSKNVWSALQDQQVFIGMTVEQAMLGWGKPDDINTTTNAYGNSEQWVYEDLNDFPQSYLYFENGILSSIQN